jgi:sigma-E factor negative regulatory protein RseA
MDTHKKIREHISTLSDGELEPADLELALAALQAADGQQAWASYHRIGDVLRAGSTPELSDGFADQLAARLAAEPAPVRRLARAATADKRRADAGHPAGVRGGAPDPSGPGAEAVSVTTAKPAIISVS